MGEYCCPQAKDRKSLMQNTKLQMRSAVVVALKEARIESVPLPEPGEGEVRVRLEGCGVCGSNLSPWEGRPWFTYPMKPGELGHEGWGLVEKVGTNVSQLQPGQRVAALCWNSYAEYDVAKEENVVPLPPELDGKPFPGEALGCAMNVFRRCDVGPKDTVAIVGIGFLGALLVSLCKQAGARVIAVTRRAFALEMARKMGADVTLGLDDQQATIAEIKNLTRGEGCARVIEATGQQEPLNLATDITRERGRLIIAGYHQEGTRQVNMQLWNWRGLDVINAHERDPHIYVEGIRMAVEAVAKGKLDPSPLYTHRFGLEQIGDALEAMRTRPENFMKALICI
jgi:threonine dehydrogenase-like Zn-dependent dehydrogenase